MNPFGAQQSTFQTHPWLGNLIHAFGGKAPGAPIAGSGGGMIQNLLQSLGTGAFFGQQLAGRGFDAGAAARSQQYAGLGAAPGSVQYLGDGNLGIKKWAGLDPEMETTAKQRTDLFKQRQQWMQRNAGSLTGASQAHLDYIYGKKKGPATKASSAIQAALNKYANL